MSETKATAPIRTLVQKTQTIRVVHLPFYSENPYQQKLMEALRSQDVVSIDGGGGGNYLRTALFRWKADILHFHWLHPYLLRQNWFGSVLRATRFLCEVNIIRRAGTRIVWTIHNLANHDQRYVEIERFYSRRFARLSDGIIVHSSSAVAAAKGTFNLGDKKLISVIPQGSYVGCYPNDVPKGECRKQLGLKHDQFVFVILGRIEPYKGVLELIHEFKTMPEDAQLVIAGRVSSSEGAQQIRTAIGGVTNIHFHEGFVPDERVQIFLNAADVYVYPAREVLNPSSVWLAMSFGLPCILPQLPSVSDALGDEGGILYYSKETSALSAALSLALQRRIELSRWGFANLRRARAFTWELAANRTNAIYRICLNSIGNERQSNKPCGNLRCSE